MNQEEINKHAELMFRNVKEMMGELTEGANDLCAYVISHLNNRPQGVPCHYKNADIVMGLLLVIDTVSQDHPNRPVMADSCAVILKMIATGEIASGNIERVLQ